MMSSHDENITRTLFMFCSQSQGRVTGSVRRMTPMVNDRARKVDFGSGEYVFLRRPSPSETGQCLEG
jgi:hypothetical protein